jgi:hypothetical protein
MSPLGTPTTEWPTAPTPGNCDNGELGGMKIDRGNRSTRRKPGPAAFCPPKIPLKRPGLEPGRPRWEASHWPLELWRGLSSEISSHYFKI